ncbi:MAG: bifunctional (p)ppGpp synthetase/guanosine-3',5'-bis(diphosphate) 3'-pyrophosphohydrolase [Clostridia bacterium]|jgi:GTP pyrophosphokinase|nr:bifunctional (p)ppGpp synthetase/guanosine-3',5'-bis(diphosphate) 3'-pyrophosphohydrolase [Clostridia bacterium]MDH7572785.1 bifunctional (p)ppGpp synthetase/guanosine-3',5'-bis(diphosphate) 3'-pyrophosphohydrolase [Clostridia bacterium]
MRIEELIKKIRAYHPEADTELLRHAHSFAARAHNGQKRRSGEEFIVHPLAVAGILAELQLDVVTIAAGILHDVVEDTPVTLEAVREEFGTEIASLVDGVTKLTRLEYRSKEEQQAENLRKMFLAMAKDIRVILIKLADRLHNLRTLGYQPPEKQREVAQETVEIFAPLAHRLGIFRLKWEMEDLSLRYLHPEIYYDLVEQIAVKRQERDAYLKDLIATLKERLEASSIKADISGRPKHFYSIYSKMRKKNCSLNEIYDLIAVRVLVETVRDCYAVLGVVHSLWKPIPGRFKDYIAMPKPNMYQSLHTTVLGPDGRPFEIQIRTWDMHRTAEYGIAAHWRYKEGRSTTDREFEEKLSWLRELLEWQREMRDPREFMETLKIDLFADRVYVFTPKGDVVELPAGSVPIDFAYHVHTAVGHQCVGAKVNGRIVPLDYQLQTGDIVEILTAKGGKPSRDWLAIVKTSQARNRIRQWFKKEEREQNSLRGRELLEKEARKQNLPLEVLKADNLEKVLGRFNFLSVEDLYAAVGDGAVSSVQVLGRLKDELDLPAETEPVPLIVPLPRRRRSTSGVRVPNVGSVEVRLAHCCHPLPGDAIRGYVTRGRGVSVHRADCPNLQYHQGSEPERIIDVTWEDNAESVYEVQIAALAVDRPRLTADIMTAIADTKTIVNAVHARATKNNLATVDLKIEISNLDQLQSIMDKVRRIRDVLEVRRVTPTS